MRTRPVPRNFKAGELAPWMDGVTNELTQQGCRTAENVIVRKNGQATQRPGTFFTKETKTSASSSVLAPVTIDDNNTYVLEIGDGYIRFYQNHAQVTYATGTAYEVTSPWSAADVRRLCIRYSANEKKILFHHPSYQSYGMTFASATSWTIEPLAFNAGKGVYVFDIGGAYIHTDDFKNWEYGRVREDLDTSNTRAYAAFGQNSILAGYQGASYSYRSEDGRTWASVGYGSTREILGNELGEYVHIQSLYTSYDDGLTWVAKNGAVSTIGVGYDNVNKTYRAQQTTTSVGLYSRDFYTWTTMTGIGTTAAIVNNPRKIVSDNADHWVECLWGGGASTSGMLLYAASLTSPWTVALISTTLCFNDAQFGNSIWVAAGGAYTAGSITYYVSSNGTTWSVGYAASYGCTYPSLIFYKNYFYSFYGDQYYDRSSDGRTWTRFPIGLSQSHLRSTAASIVDERSNQETFTTSGMYPAFGEMHEGRLVLGGFNTSPSTLYGSKVGRIYNYYLGDYADESWKYDITGDKNIDIRWAKSVPGGLLVGTRSAEGILVGSPDEGITPGTAQFRWLSTYGSASVEPVRVGDAVLFVQRGEEIVRAYIPARPMQSPELTEYADHIAAGGITEIDYQSDPQGIAYFVRADGQLLALTLDQNIRAWTRIKTASTAGSAGIIESIAVIPTSGAEDEVWTIVRRVVGGSVKRYVEYFDTLQVASKADAHYLDCGVEITSGTTFSTVGGLTHLAGEIVDALIDGTRVVSGLTVAASGTISFLPYSGTQVHVGLPYTGTIQTMRGDYGSTYGDGTALNKRTSNVVCWVHDSLATARFGPTASGATEPIVYSSSTALNTEVAMVNFPGQWDRDGYIWCVVRDPRPFTLVAMIPDSETGDR